MAVVLLMHRRLTTSLHESIIPQTPYLPHNMAEREREGEGGDHVGVGIKYELGKEEQSAA